MPTPQRYACDCATSTGSVAAVVAGKSTVVRHIAPLHELRLYVTDDVMVDDASRREPEGAPLLREFMAMGMDERWVSR